jgi:hypothetical protein
LIAFTLLTPWPYYWLVLFFLPQPPITKHAGLGILGSFCFVFSLPPWPHTPLHPSSCIFTHIHSFFAIFGKNGKTSCPGKFPRP